MNFFVLYSWFISQQTHTFFNQLFQRNGRFLLFGAKVPNQNKFSLWKPQKHLIISKINNNIIFDVVFFLLSKINARENNIMAASYLHSTLHQCSSAIIFFPFVQFAFIFLAYILFPFELNLFPFVWRERETETKKQCNLKISGRRIQMIIHHIATAWIVWICIPLPQATSLRILY